MWKPTEGFSLIKQELHFYRIQPMRDTNPFSKHQLAILQEPT